MSSNSGRKWSVGSTRHYPMAEPPKYKSSSLPRARGGGRSSRLMHCRSCRRYAEASDAAKNHTGHLVYLVTKWGRPHSVNAFAIGSSGGVKLPRFRGHRLFWVRGVHDGQDKSSLPA